VGDDQPGAPAQGREAGPVNPREEARPAAGAAPAKERIRAAGRRTASVGLLQDLRSRSHPRGNRAPICAPTGAAFARRPAASEQEALKDARRSLGRQLAAWRFQAGLTQGHLARRKGYHRITIAHAAAGDRAAGWAWPGRCAGTHRRPPCLFLCRAPWSPAQLLPQIPGQPALPFIAPGATARCSNGDPGGDKGDRLGRGLQAPSTRGGAIPDATAVSPAVITWAATSCPSYPRRAAGDREWLPAAWSVPGHVAIWGGLLRYAGY
jgi:hypothetical protein